MFSAWLPALSVDPSLVLLPSLLEQLQQSSFHLSKSLVVFAQASARRPFAA
jgi:hypothetical protein